MHKVKRYFGTNIKTNKQTCKRTHHSSKRISPRCSSTVRNRRTANRTVPRNRRTSPHRLRPQAATRTSSPPRHHLTSRRLRWRGRTCIRAWTRTCSNPCRCTFRRWVALLRRRDRCSGRWRSPRSGSSSRNKKRQNRPTPLRDKNIRHFKEGHGGFSQR